MSVDLSDFDMSDVGELRGDFTPMPRAEYQLFIDETERRETKDGASAYMAVTFVVRGGEYDGRKVWHNFNLWNTKSTDAVNIAKAEWSAICQATVGRPAVSNSSEVHHKPFFATIDIEERNNGKFGNKIIFSKGSIKPASGTVGTSAPKMAVGGKKTPW